MSGRTLRQLFALGLAALLWATAARASLAALLLAYLVALAVLGLPAVREFLAAQRPGAVLGLALLMAAPGVGFAVRQQRELLEHEGLHGLASHLADRLRLQLTPSIAPPLLVADRPQTFYVYAPAAAQARVRLWAGAPTLQGQALGQGVFRVDYDPKRHGLPVPADGTLQATIETERERVTRTLRSATALAHPRWLALSPDRRHAAAVSSETDELVVVSRAGLVRRIPTLDGPSECVFLDDSHVAVSHWNDPALAIFDLSADAPAVRVSIGARQLHLALSLDGSLLAVGVAGREPAIVLLDARSLQVRQRIALATTPDWLVFARGGSLIVSTRAPAALLRLRARGPSYAVDASLALSRPAVTLARAWDGSRVFFAATDYDPHAQPQLGNHFVQDQLLTLDPESMQVTARLLTGRRSSRQSKPGDQDRGASPMGLWQGPDGALLIAFAGSDELWRMRAGAVDPEILELGAYALQAPHGVAQLADGSLLVSSPLQGTLGIFAPGARAAIHVRLAPDDRSLLAKNRAAMQRRVGERGFYEATRSGISCQSCHLHGDSDEAAYNLGDHRLIPTLGVRGLLHSSPYLRDGSYPELADLDDVAQTLYRGYLRRQGARGQTLQAYIEALPRREPVPQARDLAREQRGLQAFFTARCPSCHAPPAFTNLATLPMQLLFPDEAARLHQPEPVDTPSLLSVSASAPYLNDGRARTLDEVLGKYNRRNLHGDSHALSAAQRADLIFFLSSL